MGLGGRFSQDFSLRIEVVTTEFRIEAGVGVTTTFIFGWSSSKAF